MPENQPLIQESLQENLQQVVRLLNKHKLVEGIVHKQAMPKQGLVEQLVHKQNIAELQKKLNQLHPADVAYILEALPREDRLIVWGLVQSENDGEILLEVSDAVRATLINDMDPAELLAAAEQLDTDEIADLAPNLPQSVVEELIGNLDEEERQEVQSALAYHEDEVGSLMDFEMVTIREDVTLEVVLRYLRRFEALPSHTDKIFVVTHDEVLRGVLSLQQLLINDPDTLVKSVMQPEVVRFMPQDNTGDAAQAFERYDLVSAPVVDAQHKLVGRLTVDAMVDVIREENESEVLNLAGLREDEDLFSSVWSSAKNRWLWVGINLCTAYLASMVIAAFDGTITQIVALAGLATIISGISGNTGTQTITLIIRGLALGQIAQGNLRAVISKELGIAVLTGLFWGVIVGLLTLLLYRNVGLALVFAFAMLLNLIVAAVMGMLIPFTMQRMGRDPAFGSAVLLTFATDSIGFFILLSLATLFLLH